MDGIISGETFYDENGTMQGYSIPGVIAGNDYYNMEGNHVGYGVPGIIAGEHIHLDDGAFGLDDPPDPDGFDWNE